VISSLGLEGNGNGLGLGNQFHHVLQLCGAAALRFKQKQGNTPIRQHFLAGTCPASPALGAGSRGHNVKRCYIAGKLRSLAGELQTGIPTLTL
jgi:hypothetical protein